MLISSFQGDFDIIGGSSPITEAEVIKVYLSCGVVYSFHDCILLRSCIYLVMFRFANNSVRSTHTITKGSFNIKDVLLCCDIEIYFNATIGDSGPCKTFL